MESGKIVLMNLSAGPQWRHRHSEQTCGHSGGGRGWALFIYFEISIHYTKDTKDTHQ